MAQAPTYTPTTDFSEDERDNVGGRSTVLTADLDTELNNIAASVNALIANQKLNQRDDGNIRDGRVKLFTLAADVLALLAVYGATPRGNWVTATQYGYKDLVSQGGNTYIAVVPHLSSVFAADLAAGRWLLFSLSASPGATQVVFTPTANIVATNVQAAIEELDSDMRALITALSNTVAANDALIRSDLASSLLLSKGAGMIAYNAALLYAAGTVGFELNKRKSVFGTGVAATDVANVNAAIAAAAANTVIELFGNFTFNATINLKPQIWLKGNGAKITHTSTTLDCLAYTPGAPTGFPGKIVIEGLEGSGAGNAGSANFINIDANAPYIFIKQCYAGSFFGFINLRDCYDTIIEQCGFYTCSFGVRLRRECHSLTWLNSQVDGATIAAFAINYGGGAGTGTCHNINLLGGALQNSAVGLWAENCLELHTVGLYHEGNTVNDYRIGVGDAGAYARACYNVIIDGFSSSSPCGSDRNIRIEHAVGVQVRGAAWNSGCSTTATLASYDGFSSRVLFDVFRYTTTTPTATAPIDCTADPTRGVVVYANRKIYGAGVTDAISAGTLASKLWTLGHQSFGGRDSAVLKSSLDVVLQVGASGVLKIKDSAGNDQFVIQVPLPTTAPGAGSKMPWYDPTDGNRMKFQP